MIKKIISIITLACFVSCGIGSETLHAVAAAGTATALRYEDTIIPAAAGRITDGKDFGSKPLVIAIQDLHCHPEVQRNIAKILAALDARCGLDAVYVEGGYGQVDTSWLTGIGEDGLRNRISGSLVGQGVLTGAEYYSITARRPRLLRGLEDEALHKANIVRLGKILGKKEYYEGRLRALDKDLAFMEAKYFGPKNRSFNRLVEKHQAGKITDDRYYSLLGKYAAAAGSDPDRFGTLIPVNLDDYPNISSYIALSAAGRHLDYRKAAREMQAFLREIKSAMPYSAYAELVRQTDNFTQLDELYLRLASIARSCRADIDARYPDLARFLDCTERSRTLNPVHMINEEKKLTAELRLVFSRDTAELDVAFLTDFYPLFKDYLLNRLSADDYEYFRQRFGKFRSVWAKYAFKDRIDELSGDFPLLDGFYATNCERNRSFLSRVESLSGMCPAGGGAEAGDIPAQPPSAIAALLKRSAVIVMVTGGFHTEGLKNLFAERGISYIAVTPNVTQDTAFSTDVYTRLAREQAGFLTHAIQLGLLAQTSLDRKYSLVLKGVSPEQIPAVLTALKNSTGIGATYDRGSGFITLDNGARFQLKATPAGEVEVQRSSPAKMLSVAVQGALEALVDVEELAEAATTGDTDKVVIAALKVAAEYDLITGNGLASSILNDPALKQLDLIRDLQPEILARFPVRVQDAIAAYQKNSFALDTVAQREEWLKILFAVDLLHDLMLRVPRKDLSGNDRPATANEENEPGTEDGDTAGGGRTASAVPEAEYTAIISGFVAQLRSIDPGWKHVPRVAWTPALKNQIFDMYVTAYGNRSMKFVDDREGDIGVDGRKVPGFREFWDYYDELFINADGDHITTFFLASRTAFGLKLNLGASDGTTAGKLKHVEAPKRMHARGVYIEASSQPLQRMLEDLEPLLWANILYGAPIAVENPVIINPRLVSVMRENKPVDVDADGAHFTALTNFAVAAKEVKRVNFGVPLVKDEQVRRHGAVRARIGKGFLLSREYRRSMEQYHAGKLDGRTLFLRFIRIAMDKDGVAAYRGPWNSAGAVQRLNSDWAEYEEFLDDWREVTARMLIAKELDAIASQEHLERPGQGIVLPLRAALDGFEAVAEKISAERKNDPVVRKLIALSAAVREQIDEVYAEGPVPSPGRIGSDVYIVSPDLLNSLEKLGPSQEDEKDRRARIETLLHIMQNKEFLSAVQNASYAEFVWKRSWERYFSEPEFSLQVRTFLNDERSFLHFREAVRQGKLAGLLRSGVTRGRLSIEGSRLVLENAGTGTKRDLGMISFPQGRPAVVTLGPSPDLPILPSIATIDDLLLYHALHYNNHSAAIMAAMADDLALRRRLAPAAQQGMAVVRAPERGKEPDRPAVEWRERADLAGLISYYEQRTPRFRQEIENDIREKAVFDHRDLLNALFDLKEGFLSGNIIDTLYFKGGRSAFRSGIVAQYRNFINEAPAALQPVINGVFEENFRTLGWDAALGEYLHREYGYTGGFRISGVEDHSIAKGVYKLMLRLTDYPERTVELFVKRADTRPVDLRNERAYLESERYFFHAMYGDDYLRHMPFYFSNPQGPDLLVSPVLGGESLGLRLRRIVASANGSGTIVAAGSGEGKRFIREIIPTLASHAALGDALGRNDRHISNSIIDQRGERTNIVDFDISNMLDADTAGREAWYLNYDWALEDVKQGISEITLLTLLDGYVWSGEEGARLEEKAGLFAQWRERYLKEWYRIMSPAGRAEIERIIETNYGDTPETAQKKKEVFEKRLRLPPETFLKNVFRAQLVDYETRKLYQEYLWKLKKAGAPLGSLESYLVPGGEKVPIAGRMEAFRELYTRSFLERRRMAGRRSIEEVFDEIETLVAGHLGEQERARLQAKAGRIARDAEEVIRLAAAPPREGSAVEKANALQATRDTVAHLDEIRSYLARTDVPPGSVLYIDVDDTMIETDGVATSRFVAQRYHMILDGIKHNIDAFRANHSAREFRVWQKRMKWALPAAMSEYVAMEKKEIDQSMIRPVDGILPLLETARSKGMQIVLATNRAPEMRRNMLAALRSIGLSFDEKDSLIVGHGDGAKAKAIVQDMETRAPAAAFFADDSRRNVDNLEKAAIPRGVALHLFHFDRPAPDTSPTPVEDLRQAILRDRPADADAWEMFLSRAVIAIAQLKDPQGKPYKEVQLKMLDEVLDIIEANGLNTREFISRTHVYQYLSEVIGYIIAPRPLLNAPRAPVPFELKVYFRVVFPFNHATAVDFYEKGKLTLAAIPESEILRTRNGAEVMLPVDENNLFLFLQPILEGILAKPPDLIVLPDTGARPYYEILRSFIEREQLPTKLLLLPASFHDTGDTIEEIVGRLKLGEQYRRSGGDLSPLQRYLAANNLFPALQGEENEGKLREVASYYAAFFPFPRSAKILLFDDNIGSGETVSALQQVFSRVGVERKKFRAATPLLMGRRGEPYTKYFTAFYAGNVSWTPWVPKILIYPSWEIIKAQRGTAARDKGEHLVTETVPGSPERRVADTFNAEALNNFWKEYDRWETGRGLRVAVHRRGTGEKILQESMETFWTNMEAVGRSVLAWIGYKRSGRAGKEGVVVHIAGAGAFRAAAERYPNDDIYSHLWVTELPSDMDAAEKAALRPVGFNVTVGERKIPTWAGTVNGSPVFYMDLADAGIGAAAYGAALSRGAAQITAQLSGTDNVEGNENEQELIRGIVAAGNIDVGLDFTPRMIVDHANNGEKVKRDFSGAGIHRVPVVSAAELEIVPGHLNAVIRRRVIRRAALNAAMAANKILKLDIDDLSEFREAVDVFNAARGGQMLVDWKVFQDALRSGRLTKERLSELLKESVKNGVMIHVAYKADDKTDLDTVRGLRDLGFQQVSLDLSALEGKEAETLRDGLKDLPLLSVTMPGNLHSPAPVISLQLDEIGKGKKFPTEAVLDIRVPASLKKEDIADYLQALPLENTIIFHSDDSQRLISTRDLLDKKAFASLFALLVNFGTPAITTPETARRLGYNWPVADLPAIKEGDAGKKQLQAILTGDLKEAGIAVDSAIAEQLQELAEQPLKQAFLNAIAEKALIRDRLFKEDSTIAEAYVRGTYRFSDLLVEEMLGVALVQESQAAAVTDRTQEEKSVEALKARIRDGHLPSILLDLHRGIKAGKPEPGAVTFVIDTILKDVFSDYNLRKNAGRKIGTVDLRTVSRILSAA